MQHPKRNLFRILLAALLAIALVACDDATRNPNPGPNPPGDEAPKDDPPGGENPEDETPEDETPAGRIDLSRAIALGIGQLTSPSGQLSLQSSSTGVVAVNDDGQVEPVQDNEITFADFKIIDGRVFLTPSDPWRYGCALVEVIDDTELECVDPFLYEFNELQVGPDGTLYYYGWAHMEETGPGPVLRKRTPEGDNEMVFDLEGPLRVESWAIASDGLLYLSGNTPEVSEGWIRRMNEDGSLTTIDTGPYHKRLISVWPDGVLYLFDHNTYALWQIRPDEDTVHAIPYLAGKHRFDEVIHDNNELQIELYGLYNHDTYPRIQDGRVMYDYRSDGDMVVAELYPNPRKLESGLAQVRAGMPRGNDYYFAGRFAPDQYGIVKLDTLTGDTETIYETSLEMFTLSVTPDGDKAFFSAFDASKNRYVMATVDLTTGETTTEPVTSNLTRLEPLH